MREMLVSVNFTMTKPCQGDKTRKNTRYTYDYKGSALLRRKFGVVC